MHTFTSKNEGMRKPGERVVVLNLQVLAGVWFTGFCVYLVGFTSLVQDTHNTCLYAVGTDSL